MAIVKLSPDSNAYNNTTTLPEALSEPNQSIFTSLYPESKISSLLKYVEGYPWTVNYYGQIFNSANTLEHVDPTAPNFTQPCYEVRGAILQVSTPLSTSYDESTGVTTVTGSALIPYKMSPNAGDFFIAQVDSGEDAVFIINTVSRKTYRKDSLYEVDYSLYMYLSADATFMPKVTARIQDTYFYNKDTNFFNRDLLITPLVKEVSDRLKLLLRESREYYFTRFLKKEFGLIIIPGTEGKYYDPFLNRFIMKTVPHDFIIDKSYGSINIFDKYVEQETFFDALLYRSVDRLDTINKTVSFAASGVMRNLSRFGTAYHAGVNYVAYPTTPDTRDDVQGVTTRTPVDLFDRGYKTASNYNVFPKQVSTVNNNTGYTKNLLHELFVGDYYVMSENFYKYQLDNTLYASVSFVEVLVLRFIQGKALTREDMHMCISTYRQWSLLHQMYLLPVLWVMISSLGV